MGFRYDTRHLRPDQQAIISRRDEENKRRNVEVEKQKQEYFQIEQLVNNGWVYDGSLQDGISLKIYFRKSGNLEKRTIELMLKENIEKAKEFFDIK